jgi:hypothetical protein
MFTCMSALPASSYTCNGQSVQTQDCSSQGQSFDTCVMDGPQGGLPDASAACTKYCAAVSGLSCAPADCQSTCDDITKNG